MIAAAIVMGRGLAPVEGSIAGVARLPAGPRQLRAAAGRVRRARRGPGAHGASGAERALSFEEVFGGPPGATRPVVGDLDFKLDAGTCLGITGPSAAGKSTLARLAVASGAPSRA